MIFCTKLIHQIRLQFFASFGFFAFILGIFMCRAARIASSKTSFNPSRVRALHSTYLHPSSSIIFRAVSFCTGPLLPSPRFSSLISILLPTKILTESLASSFNSGNHYNNLQTHTFLRALTKESGSVTEKVIKNTSQCE